MQIQSMIMEDINNKDAVCPGMSVDKLANKYAEYDIVATLNAGQVINKVNAQKEECSRCGRQAMQPSTTMHIYEMKSDPIKARAQIGQEAHLFCRNGTRLPLQLW